MIFRKLLREIFLKWRNPERYFIERKIFPKIKNKKILWVGIGSYTANYPKKLKNNDLTTIDINPHVSKYGSKKHIVEDITKVKFNDKFDIIFFLGVFGYGVDTKSQVEATFRNCYNFLKENGILVVSVSKLPQHKIPIRKSKNYYLFQPIEAYSYKSLTEVGNSVYEFLLKK
jgi:SAM-dependent methyltransferase